LDRAGQKKALKPAVRIDFCPIHHKSLWKTFWGDAAGDALTRYIPWHKVY
jgi:hypothetical protein